MDIATDRADDVAVVSPRGTRVTYGTLLAHADALADSMRATFARIADEGDGDDGVMTHEPPPEDVLKGERVAISAVPGPEYAAAMQATWMCGAIAVPIARGHTKAEMAHVLRDSGAALFAHVPEHLTDEEHADGRDAMDAFEFVESVGIQRMVTVPRVDERTSMDGIMRRKKTANPMGRERNASSDGALIIYTSGTTGAPKGVLHTHGSLAAQCTALMNAWEWSRYDRMYHVLPLHHIHGIVNGWMCAAAAGATVEFAGDASFAPRAAWSRLRDVDLPPVTIFMGVPTMYVMMLRAHEGAKRRNRGEAAASAAAARSLRLTVSGSAACPEPVARAWMETTGSDVIFLERYGMTEIGMALSNPLHGERRAGTVGKPLPGVEVRLDVNPGEEEGPGELLVRGPTVFKEYWNAPSVTSSSFTPDGFFRTGDPAVREEGGYWRILGRTSVDIIKTGGFKVSALETEAVLLTHPRIAECAVFGVPDDAYGEVSVAVTALKEEDVEGTAVDVEGTAVDASELARWARMNMAEYKAPRTFHLIDEIPRNAMGKVNKKELRRLYLDGSL